MRKILLVLLLVLGTMVTAQEKNFRQHSIEFKTGYSYLDDQHAKTEDRLPSHFGIAYRINYRPAFGWRTSVDYDRLKLDNGVTEDFVRLTIAPSFDILDIIDIYNPKWTLLGHAGAGVGRLLGETRGVGVAGVKVVHKVSERIVLQLGYDYTAIFYQDMTWDKVRPTTARGVTSVVHNLSLGINWTPKKPRDERMHADWVMPECCAKGDTTIVNNITNVNKEITQVIKEEYKPVIREYVFFDHDEEEIRKSELNAIMQIFTHLRENPESEVHIIGWASNTKSSKEYNLALSERRCKELILKLMDLGIPMSRITTDPSGKDYDMSVENVHDLARRVELLIKN